MNKALILLGFLLTSPLFACAQLPKWSWAVNGMDVGVGSGHSVATDSAGYVYITGSFSGQMTIDTITLNAAGKTDILIAKFTPTGQIIWAKRFGGLWNDQGMGIVVDKQGGIFVAGTFSDVVNFSGNILTAKGVVDNLQRDVFILKLDNAANLQWVKAAGSPYPDHISYEDIGGGSGIALDNTGNVYITGDFDSNGQSPPSHDSIMFDGTLLISNGSDDIFIVKYGSDGTLKWAKKAGGSGPDYGMSISVDKGGNTYVTGNTGRVYAWFDSIKLLTSVPFGSAFIAKYDSNGNALWARAAQSALPASGRSVTVDDSGNSYIAGGYITKIDFGGSNVLSTSGNASFLAKYSTQGNVVWAKSFGGGSNTNLGTGITMDKDGNVLMIGKFDYVNTFGNYTLTAGGVDAYVVKFDPSGNALWATKTDGAGGDDLGNGIVGDNSGNIYIIGGYKSPYISFGNHTLNNAGDRDLYLAQLSRAATYIQSPLREAIPLVFPNPAGSLINIIANQPGIINYTIINVIGEIMTVGEMQFNQSIDVSKLVDGVYYIRFASKSMTATTQKIIVQH